ncbi:biotin/lipoyl-containing protein [Wenyingzhuangia sp. IMCC45574]
MSFLKKIISIFQPTPEASLAVGKTAKEDEYKLCEWLVPDNSFIKQGDILVEIENNKATLELESYHSGQIQIKTLNNTIIHPGDLLAKITLDDNSIIELTAPSMRTTYGSDTPGQSDKNTTVISMPQLSNKTKEYKISKWLVSSDQTIHQGDILAEIETDKATMEFESFSSGTIEIITKEGTTVKVGDIIAKIHH